MLKAHLEPDLASYGAGISAYEKGGRWQRALSLFGDMRETKVEPNVIYGTFTCSVRGWEGGVGRNRLHFFNRADGLVNPPY